MKKLEIIPVNGAWVAVDKDIWIKPNDYYYHKNNIIKHAEDGTHIMLTKNDFGGKIIYVHPSLNIPVEPLVMPWEEKIDTKALADRQWEGCDGCDAHDEYFWKNGFRSGYNYATADQSKGCFTEEQIKTLAADLANKFYYMGRNKEYLDVPNDVPNIVDIYIQSLRPIPKYLVIHDDGSKKFEY